MNIISSYIAKTLMQPFYGNFASCLHKVHPTQLTILVSHLFLHVIHNCLSYTLKLRSIYFHCFLFYKNL